jgi:hypothetical protein
VKVAKPEIEEDDEFAEGPVLKAFKREAPEQEEYDAPEKAAHINLYEQRMKAQKFREMDSEQRF